MAYCTLNSYINPPKITSDKSTYICTVYKVYIVKQTFHIYWHLIYFTFRESSGAQTNQSVNLFVCIFLLHVTLSSAWTFSNYLVPLWLQIFPLFYMPIRWCNQLFILPSFSFPLKKNCIASDSAANGKRYLVHRVMVWRKTKIKKK